MPSVPRVQRWSLTQHLMEEQTRYNTSFTRISVLLKLFEAWNNGHQGLQQTMEFIPDNVFEAMVRGHPGHLMWAARHGNSALRS